MDLKMCIRDRHFSGAALNKSVDELVCKGYVQSHGENIRRDNQIYRAYSDAFSETAFQVQHRHAGLFRPFGYACHRDGGEHTRKDYRTVLTGGERTSAIVCLDCRRAGLSFRLRFDFNKSVLGGINDYTCGYRI